jgi:hypothetical protein
LKEYTDLELALHLPAKLLEAALHQLLQRARAIESEWHRCYGLAILAPHLPAKERKAVLVGALQAEERKAYHPGELCRLVAALVPHSPAEEREAVLAEALQAARVLSGTRLRAEAMLAIVPHLLPSEREVPLVEILQATLSNDRGGFGHDSERFEVLTTLAPLLPSSLVPNALQAAGEIQYELYRCIGVVALAPHLPAGQREAALAQALHTARTTEYLTDRSQTLSAAAPHLPAGQREAVLAEAVQAAREIEDNWERSRALAFPAPQLASLSRAALSSPWIDTLHCLASRSRPDLLDDLQVMVPVIVSLAGPHRQDECDELIRAIEDVGRWWP